MLKMSTTHWLIMFRVVPPQMEKRSSDLNSEIKI